MEISPVERFNEWFQEELCLTKAKVPTACCLSTIGLDGFPNARFVSLKDVVQNNFIVTGPLSSRKGMEIEATNKVALTFWWTETERQVRIQGSAVAISTQLADKYFSDRNRESQIVSIVSKQGQTIDNVEMLIERYEEIETTFSGKTLTRPENWGGYSIEPIRLEFLEFKDTRFHSRKLYEFTGRKWIVNQLQP